jgi:hypothetical protein
MTGTDWSSGQAIKDSQRRKMKDSPLGNLNRLTALPTVPAS